MGAPRKPDLEHRLEAYFGALRSSSLGEALKRSAGSWQLYAAVTGSAMAMVTSASAALIGSGIRDVTAGRMASARLSRQRLAASRNVPLVRAVRLAMAKQDALLADVKTGSASQAQQVQAPSISPGGVVPLDSTVGTIQPGEWISIYGTNLAPGTAVWNGDFPTSLGGVQVTINGKDAYLLFVSPGQIDLQAPDDTATGAVSVVVTTAAGSATATVTLSPFAPSFTLIDSKHVSGVILRSNGLGAYGGGAYDILGPTGSSLGFPTVAAQEGDILELFGVGFGPTTPTVQAGTAFSGAAPVNNTVGLYVNNVVIQPTFVGLASAGLYQINLVVPPGLGSGDVPIHAIVGGLETQAGAVIPLQSVSTGPVYPVTGGSVGGGGTNPIIFFSSSGGGTSGGPGGGSGGGTDGGGGGSGGGSSQAQPSRKPYAPRLRFPQA